MKKPKQVLIDVVAMGRKGGKVRAQRLTKAERSAQARHAARSRWDTVYAAKARKLAASLTPIQRLANGKTK